MKDIINDLVKILPFIFFKTEVDTRKLLLKVYLQRNNEERLAVLNNEARKTIEQIVELQDAALFDMIEYAEYFKYFEREPDENSIIIRGDSGTSFTEDYIELFIENLSISKANKLQQIISKNNPANKSNILGLSPQQEQMLSNISEIKKLPYMKSFMDALNYFGYLELIYENIESIKSDGFIIWSTDARNKTRSVIEEEFNTMDAKGWKYAFKCEEDYNSYCDLLTNFFESRIVDLPDMSIELKTKTKTKVAKTLGNIYQELLENMKNNKEYFNVVRILSPYKRLPDNDIYEMLRK